MTLKYSNSHANICFDCKNACGGCSWTEFDTKAGHPRFEPVPGWTAEPAILNLGNSHGRPQLRETYHITACPEFVLG